MLPQRRKTPSISVTSSGKLAAVLAISRTLLVCFWNAFGNKTLTDIAFSHLAQHLVHCVVFLDKGFKVRQPRANRLALFKTPCRQSVVFRPLPVMQDTVSSSGLMRPCAYSRAVTAVVTPPAVSVKMPSVSASS